MSKPGGYNKTNPYKIDEFEVAHAIKNSKTQEIIRTVFNTGFYKSKTDRKIAIVLTQPLSEDGLCLESEKINFYLKVKNILEKKYEVFVKPHPRDESNYSQEFQGNLIDKKIMMELIRFEKSIDLVVSINSTAAYNVPGSKCVHQFLPHQEFTSFYSIDLESLYEL
ncbi:hypothetical protein QNE28_004371 [Vibrio fluvialis]|nr:hypothetical protein [Vibrio fluvialis]